MEQQAVDTLIQSYVAAWSEPDPDTRRTLLEAVWAPEGAYTDPLSHASGLEALHRVIAGFQAENPGARFSLQGVVDHHHRYVRFYWTLHFANGRTIDGMDYGEVTADGMLRKLVGFF